MSGVVSKYIIQDGDIIGTTHAKETQLLAFQHLDLDFDPRPLQSLARVLIVLSPLPLPLLLPILERVLQSLQEIQRGHLARQLLDQFHIQNRDRVPALVWVLTQAAFKVHISGEGDDDAEETTSACV